MAFIKAAMTAVSHDGNAVLSHDGHAVLSNYGDAVLSRDDTDNVEP